MIFHLWIFIFSTSQSDSPIVRTIATGQIFTWKHSLLKLLSFCYKGQGLEGLWSYPKWIQGPTSPKNMTQMIPTKVWFSTTLDLVCFSFCGEGIPNLLESFMATCKIHVLCILYHIQARISLIKYLSLT